MTQLSHKNKENSYFMSDDFEQDEEWKFTTTKSANSHVTTRTKAMSFDEEDGQQHDSDDVSELSIGTARVVTPTAPADQVANNRGIPNVIIICIKTAIVANPPTPSPSPTSPTYIDRPFRRQPRGLVHSYAIGSIVGQSSALVMSDRDLTSYEFQQTRRANGKLNTLVADDPALSPTTSTTAATTNRRRSSRVLVNEVVYILGKVSKPFCRLSRRHRMPLYHLEPSQQGCLC